MKELEIDYEFDGFKAIVDAAVGAKKPARKASTDSSSKKPAAKDAKKAKKSKK